MIEMRREYWEEVLRTEVRTADALERIADTLEPRPPEIRLSEVREPQILAVVNQAQYQLLKNRVESYRKPTAGSLAHLYAQDVAYLLEVLEQAGLIEPDLSLCTLCGGNPDAPPHKHTYPNQQG